MADENEIYQAKLARVMAQARRGEGKLASLYRETSRKVRDAVRGDKLSATQLQERVQAAFESTLFARVRIIRGVIEIGADEGPSAARKTFRAVYGDDVTSTQLRGDATALEEAADRIAGRVTPDRVSLSKRVRKWDRTIGDELAREVGTAIKTRRGILDAAEKIQQADTYQAKLPGYLEDVERLARGGSTPELRKVVKSNLSKVRRALGEIQPDGSRIASKFSLRSASQKFLRDIDKAAETDIDGIVASYVEQRAAYQSRLIARHETVEAFRRSYVEQTSSKPGCIGHKWTLSNRHVVPDECDLFANQNAYGLGPGVYPEGKLPSRHPNCLCTLTAVLDRRHFDRPASQRSGVPSDMRDDESPDAIGWMINNQGISERIVGPTRWAAFKIGGVDILDGDGRPRLVRDVLPDMARRQAAE
jgi:hypothetical protein